MFLRKVIAFIKRDFLITTSYKASFIIDFLLIFIWVLIWYFLAKIFGDKAIPYLRDYGGFLPFVLIGLILYAYFVTTLRGYSESIRIAQITATLEPILITPLKIPHLIAFSILWRLIFDSIEVFFYVLLGVCLFKVDLSHANILAAIIILILSIISFSGIGIILASFIVAFKEGSRLPTVLISLFTFLGGVFFPVTVLPKSLQSISSFLPITYSLRSLRYAILKGASFADLSLDIYILLLFSLILLPLSLFIFKYAVEKTKREGSLSYY